MILSDRVCWVLGSARPRISLRFPVPSNFRSDSCFPWSLVFYSTGRGGRGGTGRICPTNMIKMVKGSTICLRLRMEVEILREAIFSAWRHSNRVFLVGLAGNIPKNNTKRLPHNGLSARSHGHVQPLRILTHPECLHSMD
jgi:hypothetical protein